MNEHELQSIITRAFAHNIYDGLTPPIVDDEVYGAYWIDPATLTIQCLFENNDAVREAQENGTCDTIKRRIKTALRREGYPEKGVKGVQIGFASWQDVDDAGGPWRYFR